MSGEYSVVITATCGSSWSLMSALLSEQDKGISITIEATTTVLYHDILHTTHIDFGLPAGVFPGQARDGFHCCVVG